MQMDNCCGCDGGTTILSAAVFAQMTWPGFAPFTTAGPGTDMIGIRYLTIEVGAYNALTDTVIVKTISSNGLNGTFNDMVTGTVADGDGPFFLGELTPAWPPDTITQDRVEWANGSYLQLSDSIALTAVKSACQDLLDSIDLGTLTLGTDSMFVTYDPIFTGSGAAHSSNSIAGNSSDWIGLCVLQGVEDPPGSGISPTKYAWCSAGSGALLTAASVGGGVFAFNPFESVAPFINSYAYSPDFPPTPGGWNGYAYENYYQLRKSVSNPVGSPVCCEDDYYNYVNVSPPSSFCQLISDDGFGNLFLDPPPLTSDLLDHAHLVITTPWFGTALTGGGCPCA